MTIFNNKNSFTYDYEPKFDEIKNILINPIEKIKFLSGSL